MSNQKLFEELAGPYFQHRSAIDFLNISFDSYEAGEGSRIPKQTVQRLQAECELGLEEACTLAYSASWLVENARNWFERELNELGVS